MPAEPESRQPSNPAQWWRRKPPTGIAGATFWLALWFGLLWLLRQVPVARVPVLGWMQVLVGVALIALAVPLAWQLIHRHLLWSLRNKLILTYLLIGLAPFVLFLTFVTISAYIAAGQFSIHLADTRMRQQRDEIGADNASHASRLARMLRDRAQQVSQQVSQAQPLGPRAPGARPAGRSGPPRGGRGRPASGAAPANAAGPAATVDQAAAIAAAEESAPIQATGEAAPDPLLARLHRHSAVYLNGAPLFAPAAPPGLAPAASVSTQAGVPLGLPSWAADLHGNQFHGLVLDGDQLYLVAIDQRHVDGGILSVITSLPVDSALLDVVAQGLGRVRLYDLVTGSSRPGAAGQSGSAARDAEGASVFGGSEPQRAFFCDLGVPFVSTMDIVDWETGQRNNVPVEVHSRPSALYRQLFGSSLGGIITSYIRNGLVALCILFALIEAIALRMALRLSGTITTSVEELYAATQHVDSGDLAYRIAAVHSGQRDQLGELARSFNRMTGSLERLMVEQQEKERLQSELSIAQEVQANLFPHRVHNLPGLELHGVCRPARSVSGDYYDFLVFQQPDAANGKRMLDTGVGIALGDISGKGISAALLMATLHSAVRAYRLAGEDLVYSDTSFAGSSSAVEARVADSGKLFESPGRILSMLNRHLYRSTTPEKYATLFLAHYDAAGAQLTYSNAGHLPPLVLGRDGKVRRLDCGGTVVGLMDGMRYQEDRIHMHPGDVLVAYSDGITEPENDFGEFGEGRLLEVVRRHRHLSLEAISEQVIQTLRTWIGAQEQPDDVTLVLARQR